MTRSHHSRAGGRAPDGALPPARRRRRASLYATLLVLVLVVAGGADVAVLSSRPQRVDVTMPTSVPSATLSPDSAQDRQPEQTWLVLGVDSRETVPEGPDYYGSASEVPGSRADVLALVQPRQGGLTVLTLPRDLVLLDADGSMERLATSYLSGAQRTVDLLCRGLGVSTTHLVVLDMAQFAAVIDSLGGLEVEVPEPVKDSYTGLSLPSAGRQRLSGSQALALVRSRHPEVLQGQTWTALSPQEGKSRRNEYITSVMTATLSAVREQTRTPWGAHRLAHELASHLTLDTGTGTTDMVSLARALASAPDTGHDRGARHDDTRAQTSHGLEIVDVPVLETDTGQNQDSPGNDVSIVAFADDTTMEVLAEHGHSPGSCTTGSR
ncbi:LytR family transcriptional regulator [Actinomyces lilanjuaniae]|uniref:LytR family transcriptional regulator n=1 Tax=Actinomyces lilanjuaniae TaxID=2321394 RepID=A0ABN5PRJ9_9ACTO|nr:LCP family protein [Actinomyces lilanjuaniae]AYD89482.1 LytR family transcriptional regulator [Actinomyces lilanjuaniae]